MKETQELGLESIALPPIGCGNGGLDWSQVRKQIDDAFSGLEIEVIVFQPTNAFTHRDEKKASGHLKMTPIRASLLKLLNAYQILEYSCTRLEAQKLGYFLQESGQPMGLEFVKEKYGPYSHRLHKSFETMNGRFIDGYGGGEMAKIRVKPGAIALADRTLLEKGDSVKDDLARVSELIKGWETPHGLELLSTVHWLRAHDTVDSYPGLLKGFAEWNERKRDKFSEYEIDVAARHLETQGWCAALS